MSDKKLTKREQDMLSPTFVMLIEFGTKWFGNDLMLASMDEFYDHCWDSWHSTDDYKQQRQKLKISLFRLLSGKAAYLGRSASIIKKLNAIKI
ncbi:hypothetical protein [Aeromonas veronii]|uniref:hypothetical protein n=1 Tax=Aeromonas veronii TaxID=654 RepID=UPI00214DB9B3|nr:hypothetical protein [Aeromonas veronii]MCR3969434.1 hypothetical protein [Aeromonas veronii]MCR3981908.1 hypothetical protein [Aeromonas veronii]